MIRDQLFQLEYDPFTVARIYEELELHPYASMETVTRRLEEFSKHLDTLPDEEKSQKMELFQNAVKNLKSPRNRVFLNLLIADPFPMEYVLKLLDNFHKTLRLDELETPPISPAYAVLEGVAREFREDSAQIVPEIPELSLSEDEISETLRSGEEAFDIRFTP